MKKITETGVIIHAPAVAVWQIITDTELWKEWGPSVSNVRCSDRIIRSGSSGHVRTVFGLWLPFEVTRFIPENEWSWKVWHINATGHRVERISKNQCRLVFNVPVWAFPYMVVCAIALRRIRHLAEQTNGVNKK